jgi:hypothetical protein
MSATDQKKPENRILHQIKLRSERYPLLLTRLSEIPIFLIPMRIPGWMRLSVFPFLLLAVVSLQAQEMEVGINGGGTYYLGDLNPSKHFLNIQPSFGIHARYTFDSRWAVRVGVNRGSIKGDAAQTRFLPSSGLAFSSSVTDIAAYGEFNFFPYYTGSERNRITPYIFAGFSLFFFNPKSGGVELRNAGTEGQNSAYEGRKPYGTYNFSIPFGVGLKVGITKRIGLQVYWEMHKAFTDYLDDVSTTYYIDIRSTSNPTPEQLLSDPTWSHQPGMERGDPANKDWFAFFGLAISYKFFLPGSKKCKELNH